ncbi:ABC1 kinase family protein [Paenibacillus ginsengarvi]|uniref:AarF/ABC1/UbiB kinase family protein n=1 Tax=Paenibacillus ginsengarvi TaxID=400777 RepID=A0A3B0CHI4_9BACL|nr:AarF/ABC1/UbiB kinase family protein [Paenibacillus ginsengarvi]RKN84218.1 AarF/ABC1/UbiB kinase family protein [Paenibacillus ginsengarvi]
MIGRRIRHINRYRDIAVALTRHGFGFVVEELDIFHLLSIPARLGLTAPRTDKKTLGERIRGVIEELGPTFIKLGQLASTRSDLIPQPIMRELEKLQDDVSPFSFEEVRQIVESELGLGLEQEFESFDPVPVAAASIGQVHLAVLQTGERVAVKVQRPAISDTIRTDLSILQNLSVLAEARFEWAKRFQIRAIMDNVGQSLTEELDYSIEARNTETLYRQSARDGSVRIPRVYTDYCSKILLTTEYMDGIKLNRPDQLAAMGYDPKRIAETLVQAMLKQIFIDGFFHADPHPGNLLVLPDHTLAFLDFGMVGRLDPEMKRHFAKLIIALMRQSTNGIVDAVLRMRLATEEVDLAQLRRDIDRLRDKYVQVPLSAISLGEAVTDLLGVAYRHRIRIPTDFILVGKSLMTVEGLVKQLDPQINMMRIAEPFGSKLLLEQYRPGKIAESFKEELAEFAELLLHAPKHVKDVINTLKKSRIEFAIPDLDKLFQKLDRIINRISFSIVLLSFSIIMSGLIIGSSLNRQASLVWHIPALEIGFFIAIFLFVWLIHAIFKSGRF